jgi:very-short-patch-repair endonuclease
MLPNSLTLKNRARRLRHAQTDAESRLWARLRARQICGAKFRRQHSIGPFIADFCCVEYGLVVELDGGQHASQADADARRSAVLTNYGYRVLRFWDNDVLSKMDSVLEQIALALADPHPCPLPKRARVRKNYLDTANDSREGEQK